MNDKWEYWVYGSAVKHFTDALSAHCVVLSENEDPSDAKDVVQIHLIGPKISEIGGSTYFTYKLLIRVKVEVDSHFLYKQTVLRGKIAAAFSDILCKQYDVALTPTIGCLERTSDIEVTPLGDRKDRGTLVNLSTISAEYQINLEN